MTRFHIRDKIVKVVKTTAKVAVLTAIVAKDVVDHGVSRTATEIKHELKEGLADAMTSDKHSLEDGGG